MMMVRWCGVCGVLGCWGGVEFDGIVCRVAWDGLCGMK